MLRPDDQRTISVVLLVGLLAVPVSCWLRPGGAFCWFDGKAAAPQTVDFLVDMNRAKWPEIAQLPAIGEVLARRIVEHRRRHGPFREAEDLAQVGGIGPATLKRIRPFLAPLSESRVASPASRR